MKKQTTPGTSLTGVERMIGMAASLTVGEMLTVQAARTPAAVAVEAEERTFTYAQFNARVNRLAHVLTSLGVRHGERVAILSENRSEYLEAAFACAKLGAILCALNWRLADPELEHCVKLTAPMAALVSPRFKPNLERIGHGAEIMLEIVVEFGADYEGRLEKAPDAEPSGPAHSEDGLYILYTSGTTGLPKGALISHRAEIARMQVNAMDMGLKSGDTFLAWPPMFHMASLDQATHLLCSGGRVIVMEGFDAERVCAIASERPLWWLALLPGMVDVMIGEALRRNLKPLDILQVGAMADLVPLHQIAEVTRLLDAPYINSFGSTETGLPPLSAGKLPIGEIPASLSKLPNSMCAFRLVDAGDNDVPDGTPGELAFRGPTLFSGYWNAPETNEKDFRGGWFHLGDMFIRNPDGTYDFVDRVKYMIKSGGENIYPAEIERVLLSEPRVDDAVVVRRQDDKWGEVPVAFIARKDETLTAEELSTRCRRELAGYKQPKEIRFVAFDDLPRSTTGKIQRHEVEKWLKE
ncbi:MAG: AMP-binding protein [bacterium]